MLVSFDFVVCELCLLVLNEQVRLTSLKLLGALDPDSERISAISNRCLVTDSLN